MLSKEARGVIAANPDLKPLIQEAFDKVKNLPRIQQQAPNKWRYADWTFTRRDSGVILGDEHEQATLPLLVTKSNVWWLRMTNFIEQKHLREFRRHLLRDNTPRGAPGQRMRLHLDHVYSSALSGNQIAPEKRLVNTVKVRAVPKAFQKETGHWLWYQLLDPDVAHYAISIFGHRATIADYNMIVGQYNTFKNLPDNLMRYWVRLLTNPLTMPTVTWRTPTADDLRQDLLEVGNLTADQLLFVEQIGPASAQYLSYAMKDPNTVPQDIKRVWTIHTSRGRHDIIAEIQSRGVAIEVLTNHFVQTKRTPRYSTVRLISRLAQSHTPTSLCHDALDRIQQQLDMHPRTNLRALTSRYGEIVHNLIGSIGPEDTSTLLHNLKTNSLDEYLDQAETAVDLYELKGRPSVTADFPF